MVDGWEDKKSAMEERYQCSPDEIKRMTTEHLKLNFLVPGVMQKNSINFTYSHYDRMVIGGAVPADTELSLNNSRHLRSEYFLQRREMGVINVGGTGNIEIDGKSYRLSKLDCLYIGRGAREVHFNSAEENEPAHFFILSTPAHTSYSTTYMSGSSATPAELGSAETSNERVIYKYIHEDGIKSCQLVMGLTILKNGSVWNTMPAHTHNRRMEAYFYFDLPGEQRVFHIMGEPQQTRHLVVANHQAIISPPWSIHSGCGTSSYSFIWGMAGENQSFTDMDSIQIKDLN